MMLRAILLIFLLSTTTSLFAQTIIDINKSPYVNIGKSTVYLEDKTTALTIRDIAGGKYDQDFAQGKQEVYNWGISKSAYWIKLQYRAEQQQHVQLVIDQPNIDSLEIYAQLAADKFHRIVSGNARPDATKTFNTTSYVFALPATQDTIRTVYIRARSGNILVVPVKLMEASQLSEELVKKYTMEAIYIGIIIALLLFTITIYFILKDITYFFYGGYVLFLGIYVILYLMGYSHLLGDTVRYFIVRFAHAFALTGYIFAICFALSFLVAHRYMPRMMPVIYVVLALCGVGAICSMIGLRAIAVQLVQMIGIIFPLLLLYMSVVIYRKGFWPARFYIPAWSVVLISLAYTILCFQGIFPMTDTTFVAIPYGSTVELFFLSFALADRIRQLKDEKQKAIEKNLVLVSEQKATLEKTVALRTGELNDTLTELRASNAIKDKLFSMVTHDVRSPVGNLYNMISMVESKVMSKEEFSELLPVIKEDTAGLLNNLTNLLRWASGQITNAVFRPEIVPLRQFFEAQMDMYKYLATVKKIDIRMACDEEIVVYSDPNYLSVVYRNLIDNAIKFTPQGGVMEMGCYVVNGMYLLYLRNSGTQLSQEKIDQILHSNKVETDAESEHSTGLGLQLCKEFLRRMGSYLLIKNEQAGGVRFYFMLPVPAPAVTAEKGNHLLPQLPFGEDSANSR